MFSGAFMRQSLRLSSKCEDHFFNSTNNDYSSLRNEAFKHIVLPFNPTPVFFIDSTTSSSVYLLPYIISLEIKNKTPEKAIPLILILTNVFCCLQQNDFQQ